MDTKSFLQFLDEQKQQDLSSELYLNTLEIQKDIVEQHAQTKKFSLQKQIQSQKNIDLFKKSKYSTYQKIDEVTNVRKKNPIPFVQNELKTHLLYQPVQNDTYRELNQHFDLPQYFQSVLEQLKLLLSRTKGQSLNVRKISEYKLGISDNARVDLTQNIEKPYLLNSNNIVDFKNDIKNVSAFNTYETQVNEVNSTVEKMNIFKNFFNQLQMNEKDQLIHKLWLTLQQSNKQNEKNNEYKGDLMLEKLALFEMNVCFYNDQFITKAYVFNSQLNRILQGDFNFIQLLHIEDHNTPLSLHPCIFGIKLYFEERLTDLKGQEGQKKIYQKPSNLPSILFINIDGFDNPLNLEIIKKFTTFNYFSIFQEFFHPDGEFSFFNFLKQRSDTLKSFFPFFLPFYEHIQEYYQEKGKFAIELFKNQPIYLLIIEKKDIGNIMRLDLILEQIKQIQKIFLKTNSCQNFSIKQSKNLINFFYNHSCLKLLFFYLFSQIILLLSQNKVKVFTIFLKFYTLKENQITSSEFIKSVIIQFFKLLYLFKKVKKRKINQDEADDKVQQKLEGLYKGVIGDEEFAFLFEEYILSRINEFNKIDAVVVSYSCVMSPHNKRTEQIFQLSEDVFFNIFTHILRRTNFRMIFVPRLIVNTFEDQQDIPQRRIYPASMVSQLSLNEQQSKLKQFTNSFQRCQEELLEYEKSVRETFGINQVQIKTERNQVRYQFENLELIKYVQNITCGFFQLVNTLNIIGKSNNISIFTDKKNILHWKFAASTVYMQNRLYGIKNQQDGNLKKPSLGQSKKEYSYFIDVLKEKEKISIQNFSDQQSIDYLREIHRTLDIIDYIFLFVHQVKKSSEFEEEINEQEIPVKKFRIINTLNKSCYLTKYSQYYVDYKNGLVYFFNILFPTVQQINNNENDLLNQVANCIGQIPSGAGNQENEIQVQKICDWKFSRITLGMHDILQDQFYYFLQNATIFTSSQKVEIEQGKRVKSKFLLFFGGEINYYDKNTNQLNLKEKNFIKSTCLYALKIQERGGSEVIYSFEEIKIFGVQEEFIKNLSYSSGVAVSCFTDKQQEKLQDNQQDKQKNKELSKFMFIFGGQYESKTDECTLQNVILYSDLTATLESIVRQQEQQKYKVKDQKDEQIFNIQSKKQQKENQNANNNLQFSTQNNFQDIQDQVLHLENIEKALEIQKEEVFYEVLIFLMQLNQDPNYKQKLLIETKEEAFLHYQKALCYKILGQKQVAYQILTTNGLMKQLCQENPKKIVYYLSHVLELGQIKFEDHNFKTLVSEILQYFVGQNISDYIQKELQFIQCKYLYEQYPEDVKKILKEYCEHYSQLKSNNQQSLHAIYSQDDRATELQKLGEIYLTLSKCYSKKKQSEFKEQLIYYQEALQFFEQMRNIPVKYTQQNFYSIIVNQIPKQNVIQLVIYLANTSKYDTNNFFSFLRISFNFDALFQLLFFYQQLVHLDSIKSVNMRKAFNLKQKSQDVDKLDTRILLIGGVNSKYQNYSDSNKQEIAHFFYPCLYLESSPIISNSTKIDIKPEHGFIQRIDLNQQFQPHQIASMNHNYILKLRQPRNYYLEVNDSKKVEHPNKYLLGQLQIEIRILEGCMLDAKKFLYIKHEDFITDDSQEIFKFQQTNLQSIKKEQEIKESSSIIVENSSTIQKSSQGDANVQEELIKKLQNQHPIYKNLEDQIDCKEMVQEASRLNRITIHDHQQKQAEYIQNLKSNIHVDENQRFHCCFFTSVSMLIETIFTKEKDIWQDKRAKPKNKAYFWEIMKQYNKKANQPSQSQNEKEQEQLTTKSLEYESVYSQIIFKQEFIKSLVSNGSPAFNKWSLSSQTAHQNETDNLLSIYWRQGSTKLIIYDDQIQKIIQVQMIIYHSKKRENITPEAGQISQVFFNQKDSHIYICVEEEWKFNYKNVLMRAPLQCLRSQSSQIIFNEEISSHNVNLNKITFTINSKDKIFGILQERYHFREESLMTTNERSLTSENQGNKWILDRQGRTSSVKLTIDDILNSFQGMNSQQINYLEIQGNFGQDVDNEMYLIPLYLAILGKEAKLSELKAITKNPKKSLKYQMRKIIELLIETLKRLNQNENDKEKPEFRSLKLQTKIPQQNLNEEAIRFLCLTNVHSLINQSFNSLILGEKMTDGSVLVKLAQDTEYKISFLDISSLKNIGSNIYENFIQYFEKKGSILKYLNISGHRQLLVKLIIKSKTDNKLTEKIRFDSLAYLDISKCSLISKYILIEYLQYLLNTSYQLRGININQMQVEGRNEPLITFVDLQKQSFTSQYVSDYFLNIYIEKEFSISLQENTEDQMIDYLKSIFGDQMNFINQDNRDYQKLIIKSKQSTEQTIQSDRIDKLMINTEAFKDPIVFSTDSKYLIFETINTLKEDKKLFSMKFYSILQSEASKTDLDKIKQSESINIQLRKQLFNKLEILNIHKLLSDEGEKFSIFGIMLDQNNRAYMCKMCLPVPTGQEITEDQIEFYQSKSNIKKYSKNWMQDCFMPILHNKKVKNTYLCIKDIYQTEGYSFFKSDVKVDLKTK